MGTLGRNVLYNVNNYKRNNPNWENDEYKALEEFCANNNYTYEVLAISFFTKQAAVKIIGI